LFRHLALRSSLAAWVLACAVTANAGTAAPRAPRMHAPLTCSSNAHAAAPAGAARLAELVRESLSDAAHRVDAGECESAPLSAEPAHHDPEFPAAFVFQSHSAKFLATCMPGHAHTRVAGASS
jgi:hypothetical protein